MTNMFPSMYRGGEDEHPHTRTQPVVEGEPLALRMGYWLLLVTATFMIFAGLVIATNGYTGDPNVDPRLAAAVERNQRIVGIVNMIVAMMLVFLVVQVRRKARRVRPWVAVIIGLIVLFDIVAFVIKAGGIAVTLIPVLLAASGFLIYRPSVEAYLNSQNEGY